MFRGPQWKALAMQARLDANEIESVRPSMIPGFEPGSVTKVVPPPPPLRKGGVKSVGQK